MQFLAGFAMLFFVLLGLFPTFFALPYYIINIM